MLDEQSNILEKIQKTTQFIYKKEINLKTKKIIIRKVKVHKN